MNIVWAYNGFIPLNGVIFEPEILNEIFLLFNTLINQFKALTKQDLAICIWLLIAIESIQIENM